MRSLGLGLGNNNPSITLTLILTLKTTAKPKMQRVAFLRLRFQDSFCIKTGLYCLLYLPQKVVGDL